VSEAAPKLLCAVVECLITKTNFRAASILETKTALRVHSTRLVLVTNTVQIA
jgi:hypothetical protein